MENRSRYPSLNMVHAAKSVRCVGQMNVISRSMGSVVLRIGNVLEPTRKCSNFPRFEEIDRRTHIWPQSHEHVPAWASSLHPAQAWEPKGPSKIPFCLRCLYVTQRGVTAVGKYVRLHGQEAMLPCWQPGHSHAFEAHTSHETTVASGTHLHGLPRPRYRGMPRTPLRSLLVHSIHPWLGHMGCL